MDADQILRWYGEYAAAMALCRAAAAARTDEVMRDLGFTRDAAGHWIRVICPAR